MTSIIRSVFEEDGKFYPQIYRQAFVWVINARIR